MEIGGKVNTKDNYVLLIRVLKWIRNASLRIDHNRSMNRYS